MAPFFQPGRKAGSKDPRILAQRAPSNPQYQPDQSQFAEQFQAEYGQIIPMPQARQLANQSFASQNTIRVEFSAFVINETLTDIPRLLVPRNPNRSSLIVWNNGAGAVTFSFGLAQASGIDVGMILSAFSVTSDANRFLEISGLAGINDVWITVASAIHAVNCIAYEGTPSLQSAG